ncbi:MAG: DUF3311 domain-containing protein [Phycisphaerae bacterium]
MKAIVALLLVLLMVLHHDVWNWKTHEPLIFGFVPIGLAWHMGISLGAGLVWFLAVKFCWPQDVDDIEEFVATRSSEGGPH